MELAITGVLFLHLLGMAALVGGSLAQLKETSKKVTPYMMHGALTQLVTGIILVGLVQANDEKIRMSVIGVKMALLGAILLLIFLGRKKLSNNQFYAICALSIINVGLALFVANN